MVDQRELIERARRGDHDAFAELVDGALRRLEQLPAVLRDPDLAGRGSGQPDRRLAGSSSVRKPDRFDAWPNRLRSTPLDPSDAVDGARSRSAHPIDSIDVPDHSAAFADREPVDAALRRLTRAIEPSLLCTTSSGCRW